MRTLLEWRCGYCDSIQQSDSAKRWSMDYCKCGESFVDLEEHYQRNMGEVVVINTSVFGEIDTGDPQTTNTINEDGEYNKFLKLCETAGILRKGANEDIFKKPLTPKEAYKKPDEGISEGLNEGTNEGINESRVIFIVFVFFLVFLLGIALGLWIETNM